MQMFQLPAQVPIVVSEREAAKESIKKRPQKHCVCRESNPDLLLGRQLS